MKKTDKIIPEPVVHVMKAPAMPGVRVLKTPVLNSDSDSLREIKHRLKKCHKDELSTTDARKILGITTDEVRSYIKKGLIKAHKKGFHYVITRYEMDRFTDNIVLR